MSPPEPRKEELSAAPVRTEVLGRDATDQKESLATEKRGYETPRRVSKLLTSGAEVTLATGWRPNASSRKKYKDHEQASKKK